jgi:Protein of unknown function (DUF3313)
MPESSARVDQAGWSGEGEFTSNFLYQALRDQLGKKFRLVEQAGPGVMVVQVAITDVQAATPVPA